MALSFRHTTFALVAGAALALSPRSATAQAPRDVAGTYNTTIVSPQGAVKAVIVLKRENGVLGGTLAADGFPVFPITSATPSDSGLKIQADTPDGGVAVAMKFGAGDKVTGTVVYQGMEMGLDGTFAGTAGGPAASAPAAASAGRLPVGAFALRTTEPLMGTATFEATCTITNATSGTFAGSCGSAGNPDVPVTGVVVEGNVVTIHGDTPVGPFRIVLTMAGTDGTGTMTLGAESAKLKATFTAR